MLLAFPLIRDLNALPAAHSGMDVEEELPSVSQGEQGKTLSTSTAAKDVLHLSFAAMATAESRPGSRELQARAAGCARLKDEA